MLHLFKGLNQNLGNFKLQSINLKKDINRDLIFDTFKSESCKVEYLASVLRKSARAFLGYFRADNIPILPKSSSGKPTLVLDLDNLILKSKFITSELRFKTKKRPYNDVFMFHLAHLYEIVCTTSIDNYESFFNKIDKYGFINYRLFLPNKTLLSTKHLNRPLEKLIILTSKNDSYNENLKQNILEIDPWKGEDDGKLLDVLDFLINTYFSNAKNLRSITNFYRDKNFFESFEKFRRKTFLKNSLIPLNLNKKYYLFLNKVNNERIHEFEKAKKAMDECIEKEKILINKDSVIKNTCFYFKKAILKIFV